MIMRLVGWCILCLVGLMQVMLVVCFFVLLRLMCSMWYFECSLKFGVCFSVGRMFRFGDVFEYMQYVQLLQQLQKLYGFICMLYGFVYGFDVFVDGSWYGCRLSECVVLKKCCVEYVLSCVGSGKLLLWFVLNMLLLLIILLLILYVCFDVLNIFLVKLKCGLSLLYVMFVFWIVIFLGMNFLLQCFLQWLCRCSFFGVIWKCMFDQCSFVLLMFLFGRNVVSCWYGSVVFCRLWWIDMVVFDRLRNSFLWMLQVSLLIVFGYVLFGQVL